MKVSSSALPFFSCESTSRLLSIDVIVPRLMPVKDLLFDSGTACCVIGGLDCELALASVIPLKAANITPVVVVKIDFRIFISVLSLLTLSRVSLQENLTIGELDDSETGIKRS